MQPLVIGMSIIPPIANSKHNTKGFTLIEILVVLVIASIVISFVMVSFTGFTHDYRIKQQAQQLADKLAFAREYAILQDKTIKIEFHNQAYRFMYQADNQWHELHNHRILKASTIRSEFKLQPNQPVIFSLTGEVSSFRLSFLDKSQQPIVILQMDSTR